jgi:hypothetical protein
MNSNRKFLGVILTIGVLSIPIASAYAEFKSTSKVGSGEDSGMSIEAGGAIVSCAAYSEPTSKASWAILKGGKGTTKGPDLRLKLESWGTCMAESSEISETTAKLNECELETTQTSEETTLKGKVVTACVAKFGSCELKLEPKANGSLKNATLYNSGEENESLILKAGFTNVATSLKGSCPGVAATTEGTLQGVVEARKVQQGAQSNFSLTVVAGKPTHLVAPGSQTEITIHRMGGAEAAPTSFLNFQLPVAGVLELVEPGARTCLITMMYKVLGPACVFKEKRIMGFGSQLLSIWGVNNIQAATLVTTG